MAKCDNCGSDDAVVHLTQIVNDQMSTYHLCETCAAAKGLETSGVQTNFPLTDFLAQMGSGEEPEAPEGQDEVACDFCGLTFEGFKETGRLGCPHCWTTFESQLRNLVRRIHGATNHVGKVYLPPDPSVSERKKRIEGLRRKLDRAVETENFERAAELRDQIQDLEPSSQSQT